MCFCIIETNQQSLHERVITMKTKLCNTSVTFTYPALLAICLTALAPMTQAADTLSETLTTGKVSGELRYRYEWVDQEGVADKARASTLRTQLGYTTGDFHGVGGFLQFEDVHVVGNERYNSTINGLTQYPVVADPASTEINQSYLSYQGLPETTLKYGRQVIVYDNQRFVGNVGWRQNEQTYDGFTLNTTVLPATNIAYAHITNVNRIFSERHPTLSDVKIDADFFNLAYKGLKPVSMVGYGYLLDYQPAQPFPVTASNKTLGLRFDGGYALGAAKLLYTAEYAKQSKYADGVSSIDAHYTYAMLGAGLGGVQIKFNYELLSGDGTYGFATPFATLHAFNGWADKFLTTPKDGIKDIFVSAGGAVQSTQLLLVYHNFSSDYFDYHYGTEWDAQASRKVGKLLTLTAKFAAYNGDSNTSNDARNIAAGLSKQIDKAWLQADVQF